VALLYAGSIPVGHPTFFGVLTLSMPETQTQTRCTDFFEMCSLILEYVKQHGGNVLLNDNPALLEIGFVTDHEDYPWWVIKLKDFRESIFRGILPKEDLDRLSLLVRGVSGRARVVKALAEGYLPWTDWDRFENSKR
jgi:hypothetical protein